MNEKISIETLEHALTELHRVAFILWSEARSDSGKTQEEVDFLGYVNRQINKVKTAVSRHRRGKEFARIQIDWEHSCERWWSNGGNAIWEQMVGGHACSTDSVTVSVEDAKEFIRAGAKIPGWEEAPFVITELN